MALELKKIVDNVYLREMSPKGFYIYSYENKNTYKTLDFDHIIWESSDIQGSIIKNGDFSVLSIEDDRTLFIDDLNGDIVGSEEFIAYDVQLNSDFEKDYIFGYKNATCRDDIFYKDVGYFYPAEDEFIVLKEQHEYGRIIWISDDFILFLNKKSIEFSNYELDKIWNLPFEKMNIQSVTNCIDYQDFIFIIANDGKVLQINKESGEILRTFQNEETGDFYNNYFINDDGMMLFLGHHSYTEISPSDLTVLNTIKFNDQNIYVKSCFFSKESQCIYFFGHYGDTFPNLIGSFDLKTYTFNWKYVLKNENTDNYFSTAPKVVGDYVAVGDGLNNLYIFEKN